MADRILLHICCGPCAIAPLARLTEAGLEVVGLFANDNIQPAAEWLRRRFAGTGEAGTFVDAVVTPTLLFCVGPLTILGSLSDGLGRGADQLLVKSVLDGFAAMAFASTLGWGVLFSAGAVGLVQGSLTLAGYLFGNLFTTGQIDALSATRADSRSSSIRARATSISSATTRRSSSCGIR